MAKRINVSEAVSAPITDHFRVTAPKPNEVNKVKRTFMLDKDLDDALGRKAIDEDTFKGDLLNRILREYLGK